MTSRIDLFENYNEQHLISDDVSLQYNILFESFTEKDFFHKIITLSCPVCETSPGSSMEQLIEHLNIVHKKRYCELCTSFNKVI